MRSFITTPIFYVNAAPHIGHLYTAVLADAAHRWNCMVGGANGCVFSTGTDEHGIKVQQAAAERGCTPRELCDQISVKFKDLFDRGDVSYTHYIRTTAEDHKSLVQRIWSSLQDRGWIYKGSYEGWYSVPDEAFLSDKQVIDGLSKGTKVSVETGHTVEWSSEENYMFKLSAFQDKLLQWIDSTPYPVYPDVYRQQVVQWLKDEPLSNLSISRPASRLKWGVAVPGDNSQTIYVWLDALINYLTVSGYPNNGHFWPATGHIVGKDILRFHAVYWPAFLMAAGLELPRRVIGHAHWTVSRSKMSKSKGNVIDPFDRLNRFGVDPLRYFLLKESSLHQDGDYSDDRITAIVNSDLADTLGNLLLRVTSHKLHPPNTEVKLHPELFPLARDGSLWDREDHKLVESLVELPEVVRDCYDNYEFGRGINSIMETLRQTNRFLENHKPWLLVADRAQQPHLQTVLAISMEGLRLCATLLRPIMPGSCDEILQRIGRSGDGFVREGVELKSWLHERTMDKCEHRTMKLGGTPLFTKIK